MAMNLIRMHDRVEIASRAEIADRFGARLKG